MIKLSKAGLSDDVIIAQIKKRPQPFDLTPDQLLQLKAARVNDRVIEAMTGVIPATAQISSTIATPSNPEKPSLDSAGSQEKDGELHRQQWESFKKSDPLTGGSYASYVLTGKYLSPPTNGNNTAPSIVLRCDPSAHHGKVAGKLLRWIR